jgi:hypothetical protein
MIAVNPHIGLGATLCAGRSVVLHGGEFWARRRVQDITCYLDLMASNGLRMVAP